MQSIQRSEYASVGGFWVRVHTTRQLVGSGLGFTLRVSWWVLGWGSHYASVGGFWVGVHTTRQLVGSGLGFTLRVSWWVLGWGSHYASVGGFWVRVHSNAVFSEREGDQLVVWP